MSCDVCAHALAHGWWGPGVKGTHCIGCHRSWAGKREAHCADCHAHFSADSVADRHRKGDRCLTRDEMAITHTDSGVPVFRRDTTKNGEIWRGGATLRLKGRPAWTTD